MSFSDVNLFGEDFFSSKRTFCSADDANQLPTMTRLRLLFLCLVAALHMHTVLAFTLVSFTTQKSRRSSPLLLTRRNAALSSYYINDSNFKQILFADSYDKAVLVDACAPWCGPCKLIESSLEQCAEEWHESLIVVKYNVEASENPNLKLELLLQNSMPQSLPCLLLFINGKVVKKHSGVITKEELDSLIETHVGGTENAKSKTKNVGAGFVSMVGDDSDDYMLSGSV